MEIPLTLASEDKKMCLIIGKIPFYQNAHAPDSQIITGDLPVSENWGCNLKY